MLHFLTINVTEEDFKLLCRKYNDEATGDINYPAFVQSIDARKSSSYFSTRGHEHYLLWINNFLWIINLHIVFCNHMLQNINSFLICRLKLFATGIDELRNDDSSQENVKEKITSNLYIRYKISMYQCLYYIYIHVYILYLQCFMSIHNGSVLRIQEWWYYNC